MQPLTWLPWCWLVWPPSSDLKWCWLPLAPFMWGWVLVGVAAFLGRRSRCLRAASAEPTRAYAVEPRQIPRNHLSYSYKFLCIASCTYSGNYDYLCRNKLVDNVHIPSHLKNANKHLPTRLAYAKKNLDCLRGRLRTPTRTVKYQVNSLRSGIRSSLEYMRLVIQKKNAAHMASSSTLL